MVASPTSGEFAMNSRTLSTIAIIGFVLLGSICDGAALPLAAGRARLPREDSQWELTYSVQFEADESDVGRKKRQVQPGHAVRYALLRCAAARRGTYPIRTCMLEFVRPSCTGSGIACSCWQPGKRRTTPYTATAKFRFAAESRGPNDGAIRRWRT